jgi:hypothetical protein
MVARGDHVYPGVPHLTRCATADASAAGAVLAIGDYQIGSSFGPNAR